MDGFHPRFSVSHSPFTVLGCYAFALPTHHVHRAATPDRVAIPIFCGRWGLPGPRRVPVRIVFGEPLSFPKTVARKEDKRSLHPGSPKGLREVTDQEVKDVHAAYMTALRKLFDDNKAKFGYPDRELRIL